MWPWLVAAGGLIGLGGLMLLAPGPDNLAPTRFRDVVIRVPQPEGLSETMVRSIAQRIGVPFRQLLVAIVLGSERGTSLAVAVAFRRELRAIAHTLFNRRRWPGTFGATWWQTAVGGRATTGTQGDRPFATSLQGATSLGGDHLGYLLEVAARVEAEQRRGENLKGITNFHHYRGDKKAQVDATWTRRGYVQVRVPGAPLATFFAPGEAKKESFS